jgi:Ataxin 2 SM domain
MQEENRLPVLVMVHKGNVRCTPSFLRLPDLHLQFGADLLTNLTNRRTNSQKAWTTVANPIAQKIPAQPQQNGNVLQAKQIPAVKTPQQKDTSTPDKHANDRLVFILAAAIVSRPQFLGYLVADCLHQGTSVTITTKSGEAYEGILSYSTPDSTETNITLSMTRRTHSAGEAQTNGIAEHESPFVGLGPDFAMTFNVRDVADVNISELSIPDAIKSQNGEQSHNIQSASTLNRSTFVEMVAARVC